jgi:hypothetical protein
MRIVAGDNGYTMRLSARDTERWARRPGAAWPCSTLAGRRVLVIVDRNGLCDIAIDGGRGDQECDGTELDAIVGDYLPENLRRYWPTWAAGVAV